MVLDNVIHHWVVLVAREEAVPKGFEGTFQWLASIFYTNGGLFVSPQMDRLQTVTDVLAGNFDWVFLKININKTAGTVYHTCCMIDSHSDSK